jgi:pilus assembly protein FimV
MNRVLPRLAALVPLLWLSSVGALGLGEIDVRSRLNQKFVASIPLTEVRGEEAASVRVTLASVAEFQRAGIERADFLSTLKFTVVDGAAPRIDISSDQIVREPYLSLLLDVRGASGRMLREYTVLLDPPEVAAARSAAAAPSFYETAEESRRAAAAPAPRVEPQPAATLKPAPMPAPAPAPQPTPEPVVEAPAPAVSTTPAAAVSASGQYGPVQNGETFWSIAKRLRPDDSVTMDQMLLAIYRANPAAFDGFNGLRRGATLNVPDLATIRATGAAEAKQEVARLRAPGASTRAPAPAVVAETPAVVRAEPIKPAAPAPQPLAPAPKTEPAPTAPASAEAPATPAPAPAPAAEAPAEAPTTETPAETPAAETSTAETPAEPTQAEAPAEATPEPEAPVAPAEAPTRADEPGGGLIESLLLPLLLGLIVLGAIGYLVSKVLAARRAKQEPGPFAAVPKRGNGRGADPKLPAAAAAAGSVVAAGAKRPSAQEELERLQDSLDQENLSNTQAQSTQQIDAGRTQSLPPADATQIFDVPPAAAPAAAGEVDFDLTGQFEAQTVQINLDANDPVSEADFHLAYGLYDEAALLLKQAAAKDPSRTDVQVKLAETYFAAGKNAEFRQVAEGLQGKASAAEWQKIGIMGQQLSPGDALYGAGPNAAAPGDMALDMTFDEPASPSSVAAPSFSPRAEADSALDFKLEDLELPSLDQDEPPPPAPKPAAGNAVEFDLSGFDIGGKSAPSAPASAAPPAADNLLDFDIGSPPPESAAAAVGDEALNLDEFELGDFAADSTTISGDEAGTKLDLARAYVDMGDNEMARTLLNEVLEQGNDQQKQEARTLIGRLG